MKRIYKTLIIQILIFIFLTIICISFFSFLNFKSSQMKMVTQKTENLNLAKDIDIYRLKIIEVEVIDVIKINENLYCFTLKDSKKNEYKYINNETENFVKEISVCKKGLLEIESFESLSGINYSNEYIDLNIK